MLRAGFPGSRARLLGLVVCAWVAVLAGAGCRPSESDAVRAARENTLLIGNGGDPENLDPHTTTGIPEYKIEMALFEGLVIEDAKTGAIIPGAATRWELSEDGRAYTFHLRPEERWSNGQPVTAEDWVYSFRRALTPELGNTYGVLYDRIQGANAFRKGESNDFASVGVRALDSLTLRIELVEPVPSFIPMLVLHTFFPVHRATIERFGAIGDRSTAWTKAGNLVGNGPFTLVSWLPGQKIVVKRNPYYWDADSVQLEEVQFFGIDSGDVEERAFRAGQIHVSYLLPTSKIAGYRDRKAPEYHNDPELAVYYYGFNTAHPPFDDVRVRRALAMAIDRSLIVERVTQGGEQPARHFYPPSASGFLAGSELNEDADEARRLMEESGYPGGAGFPVVTLLYNTLESHRQIAEAVQQMWRRELGIDVRLRNEEWKVYLASRKTGDYEIARAGWVAAYDDVSVFADLLVSDNGNNQTGWGSAEYDRLVRSAAVELDGKQRAAFYQRAENILANEMPVIPIYFYRHNYLVRPEVHGWYENALDHHPLREVWLEPE